METSSIQQVKETEVEADGFPRTRKATRAEMHRVDSVHLKKTCCRDAKKERGKEESK